MRKLTAIILSLLLCTVVLAGCQNGTSSSSSDTESQSTSVQSDESTSSEDDTQTGAQSVQINIGALKGPTAMGMVKLMDDAEAGEMNGNIYDFTIAASADELVPMLVQGKLDIAAVPANLSSVLYNNTEGAIQVLAIHTLGVLHIVENGETINSIEDLDGRTIYSAGKSGPLEYALNYILEESGMADKVNIEWKSEHSESVAAILADENAIALLPQPFVTTAKVQNPGLRSALNLTEEWEKLQADEDEPSALLTGVLVARREFIEENPDALEEFLQQYALSVEYVNANTEPAAQLVEKFDIIPAAVAEKALPECGITFIDGFEMREKLSGYLNVLYSQNPQAVGGELPDDDFYFIRMSGMLR